MPSVPWRCTAALRCIVYGVLALKTSERIWIRIWVHSRGAAERRRREADHLVAAGYLVEATDYEGEAPLAIGGKKPFLAIIDATPPAPKPLTDW